MILATNHASADSLPAEDVTRYLEQAARNGDAHAQFRMGARYDGGVGTAKNPTLAADMYLKAALAGITEAYPIIAAKLEVGLGKIRSEVEAARWYEAAAEAGDVPSQLRIAEWYARGRAVPRDEAKAAAWYERAAGARSPAAMYEIGMRYLQGRGVAEVPRYRSRLAPEGRRGGERRRPPGAQPPRRLTAHQSIRAPRLMTRPRSDTHGAAVSRPPSSGVAKNTGS